MTEQPVELNLPSRIASIDEAATAVTDAARRIGFPDEALFGIELAVREAVTNAVLHGNRQDESVPVEVGVSDAGAEMVVTVRDRGTGFGPARVADPPAASRQLYALALDCDAIAHLRSVALRWSKSPVIRTG